MCYQRTKNNIINNIQDVAVRLAVLGSLMRNKSAIIGSLRKL